MVTVTQRSEPNIQSSSSSFGAAIAAALVASTLPVLVAVVFLISAGAHRPVLASARWQWLLPRSDPAQPTPRLAKDMTTVWGLTLLVIGALQGAGAAFAGISIFNPIGTLIRTVSALVLGVAVYAGTVFYVRRRYGPPARSGPKKGSPDVQVGRRADIRSAFDISRLSEVEQLMRESEAHYASHYTLCLAFSTTP